MMSAFGNAIESMLESSLQRFGSDYIDMDWIHSRRTEKQDNAVACGASRNPLIISRRCRYIATASPLRRSGTAPPHGVALPSRRNGTAPAAQRPERKNRTKGDLGATRCRPSALSYSSPRGSAAIPSPLSAAGAYLAVFCPGQTALPPAEGVSSAPLRL